MSFRFSEVKKPATTRFETKTDSKNASTNSASLFANVSSLKEMLYEKLLESKGGIKQLYEFIIKQPDPQTRLTLQAACFPRMAKHLCQAAIQREYKEVDRLLKYCPLLLLETATVIDYSGRKHIDRTVYQLVLGAKDKNIKRVKWDDDRDELVIEEDKIAIAGMIEMIEKHFSKLSELDYKAIMQKQYDEQYPANYKAIEEKEDAEDDAAYDAGLNVVRHASNAICEITNKLEDDIHKIRRGEKSQRADELRNITQSIYNANTQDFKAEFDKLKVYLQKEKLVNDSFDFTVLEAIYRFRNYWESKLKKEFTIGRHFNHGALDKAKMKYDANYKAFGDGGFDTWNAPKNILCFKKLYGYIGRFVPACDGKIIAQGQWGVLVQGEKFRNSLDWSSGSGHYFPLADDSDWELGHNYGPGGACVAQRWRDEWPESFQYLFRAKTPTLCHYALEIQSSTKERLRDNPTPAIACVIL